MRVLLIVTCLLTFALSSLAASVNTSAPEANHLCGAVIADHSEGALHNHCKDGVDHSECDGCCIQAHSVAMLVSANVVIPFLTKKNVLRREIAQYYSYDPSSLYRPPRL